MAVDAVNDELIELLSMIVLWLVLFSSDPFINPSVLLRQIECKLVNDVLQVASTFFKYALMPAWLPSLHDRFVYLVDP